MVGFCHGGSLPESHDNKYDEDEGETTLPYKLSAKENFIRWVNILCIWNCSLPWVRVSDVITFIVFDPFTELLMTLCTVVNIVFMVMNDYQIECDNNDWEDDGYLDGM